MHVFTSKPLFLNEDEKVSAINILLGSLSHYLPPIVARYVSLYFKIYRTVFPFAIIAGIWP